jgi:3-deoxy-D-manno-octulosonic-acid transferase
LIPLSATTTRATLSRALYVGLMRLLLPLAMLRVYLKSRHQRLCRKDLRQRWGMYPTQPRHGSKTNVLPLVWIHAVSLGETHVAGLLIKTWRSLYPDSRFLLTHTTATGYEAGQSLLEPGDAQAWAVWDTPGSVSRFLSHWRPQLGVLIETEVWPMTSWQCHQQGIPLVLVNARLSKRSATRALRWASLMQPAYAQLAGVWAQTLADAKRLEQVGASIAAITGNMKFDAKPSSTQLAKGQTWRDQEERPVVVLASSREGEEALFLTTLRRLHQKNPLVFSSVRWLIVPRHPERFDAVALLINASGFEVTRRSHWLDEMPFVPPPKSPQKGRAWIDLGDSLGEMTSYYTWADIALLGGSFEPYGGQNLIEALACQCPVILGPHTFHFEQVAEQAIQQGCALRVPDMEAGITEALSLLNAPNRRTAMLAKAIDFVTSHQGACRATTQALQTLLVSHSNA